MAQTRSNWKWDEKFGKNLFEKTHSTYIENDVKTIDYLVNFTIEGIGMKLSFALFVDLASYDKNSNANTNNTSYLIEESTIFYQDLFFSQLKQNADFLLKIHFGDFKVKYLSGSGRKSKSLEEISNESKKELLLETELEETLYRLYLAFIFPKEMFRPAIIYVPTSLDKTKTNETFLYVYTPSERL